MSKGSWMMSEEGGSELRISYLTIYMKRQI